MGETGRIWCGRAKVNLESTPCRCLTTRFVEFFYTNNSISATLTPVRFEVFITQLNAHLPHDQHHFALVSFISFDSFFVVSYASHTRVSWAIWHMMQVAHYRINQNPDGTCFIRAKQLFNSIPELIDHHKTKTSGLPVLLEYAISHLHLVSENQTARRLIVHDALCFLSTFPSKLSSCKRLSELGLLFDSLSLRSMSRSPAASSCAADVDDPAMTCHGRRVVCVTAVVRDCESRR